MRQSRWVLGTILGVAFGGGFAVGVAEAEVRYQYVTDANVVTRTAGQSASVNVYLQETLTGGSPSLLLADAGIFGAGFHVQSSSALASPSVLLAITANTTDFGTVSSGAAGTGKFLFEAVTLPAASGPMGSDLGGGVRQVLLSTLDLQAGMDLGPTTFTLLGYQGNTLTFTNGYALDTTQVTTPAFTGTSASSATIVTFTVVPVPEPASLGLLGLVAIGVLRRRRSSPVAE